MITKDSPDWPRLREWLNTEIEKRRRLLEGKRRSHDESNQDRGFIEAFRHLIQIVEPKPKAEGGGSSTNYNA
jgi:hypothetical protein